MESQLAIRPSSSETSTAIASFTKFVTEHPETRFIHFEWVDYNGLRRLRVVPISTAQKMVTQVTKKLGVTVASFSLVQNDHPTAQMSVVGEWLIDPIWTSLRATATPTHATLCCAFLQPQHGPLAINQVKPSPVCPRSALVRAVEHASTQDLDFLVGFETEFVLFQQETLQPLKGGHAWSTTVALKPKVMACLDEIVLVLQENGIEVIYLHPESCTGQFEVVTGPRTPLEAVDALYYTRGTIDTVASKHGFRATLHPKPFPEQAGTAAHIHLSVSRPGADNCDEAFFAGVLKHLSAIAAFGLSSTTSYDRLQDGCWAGGTWNCWADQNREVPLRRVNQKDRHWEVRCVDGTANAYLALAALLLAGTTGCAENMTLPKPCTGDPSKLSVEERDSIAQGSLPRSLHEALDALVSDTEMVKLLGEPVVNQFRDVKEAEIKLFESMSANQRWKLMAEMY